MCIALGLGSAIGVWLLQRRHLLAAPAESTIMTGPEHRNLLTDNPALYEARFPDPDHTAARFVDDILRAYLPAQTTGQGVSRIRYSTSGVGLAATSAT